MTLEVALLDRRPRLLGAVKLVDSNEEQITKLRESVDVSRLLGGRERSVGRERGVDQGLAVKQFPGHDVDPQHKFEPKDRLAQSRVHSSPNLLRRLATQASMHALVGFPTQAIGRLLIGV